MWFNRLRILFHHVDSRPSVFEKQFYNFCTTARRLDVPKNSYQFTKQDEDIILKIINNSEADELKAYDVKETQLKKLLAYKQKNGSFESFNDALMIQDVTLFIKFCKSILDGDKKISKSPLKSPKALPTSKNLIAPPLSDNHSTIKSILGLHMWGNALSWALLGDDNKISEWDYLNFDISPKMSILSMVDIVADAALQLPSADAYVMESEGYAALGKMKPSIYQFHLMRQQLVAIIISALKMRSHMNKDMSGESESMSNFYMTQARLPSKVFKLNIGSETVSAQSIIEELIAHQRVAAVPNVNRIIIDPELAEKHQSHELVIREQLNSALLLTLTFYNYAVINKRINCS